MNQNKPAIDIGTVFTFRRRGAVEVKNLLPGIHATPYVLDRQRGVWVMYLRFEPNAAMPQHLHTGPTHFYTTAGSWVGSDRPDEIHYAGAYIYAHAGSVHSFQSKLGTEGFVVGEGALIVEDDNAGTLVVDAGWIENRVSELTQSAGQALPQYVSYLVAPPALDSSL